MSDGRDPILTPGFRNKESRPLVPEWAGEAIFVILMLIVGFMAGYLVATVQTTHCFEDEVIVWDGDAHTRCVPLDDLVDLP